MPITVISFKICPYVFRVVAALHHYAIPFELKYIDLQNKPEWFEQISPLGKVPLLIVDEKVIFESNVILDYINTLIDGKGFPADAVDRAIAKAKMEFASEVQSTLGTLYYRAKTQEEIDEKTADLKWYFEKLTPWLSETPFLGGAEPSLVDFAFCSIFAMLRAIQPINKINPLEGFPKLQEYDERVNSLEGVQKAKVQGYQEMVQGYLKKLKSPMIVEAQKQGEDVKAD